MDYKEYYKEYYKDNKEKLKNYYKQYYQEHKEYHKEYHKDYYKDNIDKYKEHYENNKEKIYKYNKEYNETNKEKLKEYYKEYNKTNKEKLKEYNKQYYLKNKKVKIKPDKMSVKKKTIQPDILKINNDLENLKSEYNKEYDNKNKKVKVKPNVKIKKEQPNILFKRNDDLENFISKQNQLIKEKKLQIYKDNEKRYNDLQYNSVQSDSISYINDENLTREIILTLGRGYLSSNLQHMLFMLSEKLFNKPPFCYNIDEKDDMIMDAYLHLCECVYLFDKDKYKKSFPYMTECCKRRFTNYFNKLKKNVSLNEIYM